MLINSAKELLDLKGKEMESGRGALSFIDEWNWNSGASKTLGAGNATGLLACGAGLSYASAHSAIMPPLIWCLAEFAAGILLFCFGYALLYTAYLMKSISDIQFAQWQSQSEEEIALLKVGHQRTPLKSDVRVDESLKSLIGHTRVLHVTFVLHGLSAILLFIGLTQILNLSIKIALVPAFLN